MDHTLAIDFGTSNSTVYVYKNNSFEALTDETGSSLFPSYVMYYNDRIVTGITAKKSMGRDGRFVVGSVKRLIGQPYSYYEQLKNKSIFGCEVVRGEDDYPYFVVSNNGMRVNCVDVACELFKEFKRRAEAYCNPRVFDAAYLTVPADYKDYQCNKIKEAARLAGLTIKKLITEPAAAALSWYYSQEDGFKNNSKFLVYDFGGGTFDVSLMKYSHEDGFVIVDQGGNPYLGGNDVDITLSEFIEQQYRNQYGTELIKKSKQALRKRSALKEKSEEIKLALFTQQCTDFDTSPFTGDELSIPVTQASFNRLIDPIVDKTLECVKLLLQRNHLQPGNISYFFMIGGSSQLTLVAEKTKKLFRDCIFPQVNRQQCVANGAALMLLADYSGNRQTVKEIMSESIGLGIGEGKVLIMLKKGGKLPLTGKSYLFKTTLDNQKQVDMKIFKYNGDLKRDEPVNMIDEAVCRYIYDLNFVLPEVRPKGEYYIEIELSMEVGGVLTVTCYDPTSGRNTIYTQEYEAVYGSYFLVCFQSFFSFFFSINCLISRVPIVFTISTVTTFTLHLSLFYSFK